MGINRKRSISVLETKLGANEDQIAYLMKIVTNSKQTGKNDVKDFMGSSFKIGNDNAFSYQSVQQSARNPTSNLRKKSGDSEFSKI